MKTITVKLFEKEAKELDKFIKNSGYASKSEFIRHLLIEKMGLERKESLGWMMLAEKSMAKIWDNPKDDEVWNKYLEDD